MGGRAERVYIVLNVVASAAATLAFSIATLYRLRVAGLDAFQLVLVGSVMEAAIFLFEVPTGIVADVFSRKVSIIIGHLGMGAAFVVEGSMASFPGVLAAQALWGVAYTFTSGATTAWIAGELEGADEATARAAGDGSGSGEAVDSRRLSTLFLRAGQWGSAVSVVMIPASFLLARTSLRVPLYVGGAVQLALGLWLVVAMPEHHFTPSAADERGTWPRMVRTAREGFGSIRASHVLVLLTLLIVVSGAASEAYDRFVQPHLLGPVGLPSAFGGSALVWLAIIATASAALGIVVPVLVRRLDPAATRRRLGHWVGGLYAVHIAGLVLFALTGSIVVAIAALLLIERARSVRFSLFGSWLVPLTPKAHRATALSAMSQADALGQITIGPVFGVIGRAASIPVALVVSAVAMVPGLEVIRRAAAAPTGPRHGGAADRREVAPGTADAGAGG